MGQGQRPIWASADGRAMLAIYTVMTRTVLSLALAFDYLLLS